MFKSELLNEIINAIPSESAATKAKARRLFTFVDDMLAKYADNDASFDEIMVDVYKEAGFNGDQTV